MAQISFVIANLDVDNLIEKSTDSYTLLFTLILFIEGRWLYLKHKSLRYAL